MMAFSADFQQIRKSVKFNQNLVDLPNCGALHHGSLFCFIEMYIQVILDVLAWSLSNFYLKTQEQVLHITLWRYWQVWDYVLVPLTQKKKSIIDLHKLWMSLMVFVRIKAEHECTHGWPRSVPMGMSNSKCHTWICVGFSHWMTQSCGAKTHGFSSACGSTDTWKYLQVLRVLNWNKID